MYRNQLIRRRRLELEKKEMKIQEFAAKVIQQLFRDILKWKRLLKRIQRERSFFKRKR
jgi:hypothetical protein